MKLIAIDQADALQQNTIDSDLLLWTFLVTAYLETGAASNKTKVSNDFAM